YGSASWKWQSTISTRRSSAAREIKIEPIAEVPSNKTMAAIPISTFHQLGSRKNAPMSRKVTPKPDAVDNTEIRANTSRKLSMPAAQTAKLNAPKTKKMSEMIRSTDISAHLAEARGRARPRPKSP